MPSSTYSIAVNESAYIKALSGENPIRQGKTTAWTREDILFSGQKSSSLNHGKMFKVGIQTLPDGSVEVVMPLGSPPDTIGYNRNKAFQMERKTKAKTRVQDALDRQNETKPEIKTKAPETQEEFMNRYKAMCDLVGAEEADKLMAADFWLD